MLTITHDFIEVPYTYKKDKDGVLWKTYIQGRARYFVDEAEISREEFIKYTEADPNWGIPLK